MAVVLLAVLGVSGVRAGRAGAESPVTVVITETDLDWPVGENSLMVWDGFGSQVSEDPKCLPMVIDWVITTIRFELVFDLSADPATLTGSLAGSGEGRHPTDDPAYGQEWASVSFSGSIVGGWAQETEAGWTWGGDADLILDFAGLRICSIDLDEWGDEVYVVAEGSGQRQLTVRLVGGAEAYGEDSGFSLDGSSAPDWEPGEDVWGISLGCNGCDVPVPLPVGGAGDVGGQVSGSGSVFGVPPWLGPGVVGGLLPGEGGQSSAQSDQGEAGEGGRWDPLGVALLILFLALIALATGIPLKTLVGDLLLTRFETFPTTPTSGQTAVLARQIVQPGPEGWEWPLVTPSSPVQPWSSPEESAGRSGFVLQPGERYTELGSTGAGPNDWVQVYLEGERGEESRMGWVPRHFLQPWRQQGEISRPIPPGWRAPTWRLRFPDHFLTRNPQGPNLTRQTPGDYWVGSTEADGYRPVYDSTGGNLLGYIAPADMPPGSSSLVQAPAPPPPPLPPPPPAR